MAIASSPSPESVTDATARAVCLVERLRAENLSLRRELERLTVYRQLALCDELTGLPNRRAFEEALRREWSRRQRCEVPFALLVIDLDEFKPINDTFGHAVGDGVLRWFAQLLAHTCRDLDVPCRIGGDEFVILLPATDRAGAEVIGQRLARAARCAEGRPRLTGHGAVGFSWGCAATDEPVGSPTELLVRADDDMYRHKRGRSHPRLVGRAGRARDVGAPEPPRSWAGHDRALLPAAFGDDPLDFGESEPARAVPSAGDEPRGGRELNVA